MKRTVLTILTAALALASCTEKQYETVALQGTLMLGDIFKSGEEFKVETKGSLAEEAPDSYVITIKDVLGETVFTDNWGNLKKTKTVLLKVGQYTLDVISSADGVPQAAFDTPVYGASESFSIAADEISQLGDVTCTLQQVLVSIDYAENFLESVTGDGVATVYLDERHPLDFFLKEDGTKEERTGYFALPSQSESITMVVSYTGSVDGRESKMTKAFDNVKAAVKHNIMFTKKEGDEGNATIIISIDDLIADADLDTDVPADEPVIGDDPDAPTGDGGITMVCTSGYDLTEPIIIPKAGETFVLTMQATIPNKVNKFQVEITSTSETFVDAVKLINDDSNVLDLVNPSEGAIEVFTTILPFPYGEAVRNKDVIDFDLSDAQTPILAFPGTHTFVMKVVDKKGCKKEINVVMVVEEPEPGPEPEE